MANESVIGKGYLGSAAAARYLGLAGQTMRRMRLDGSGPRYFRVGKPLTGRCFYAIEDLDAWVRAREYASTAQETVATSGRAA